MGASRDTVPTPEAEQANQAVLDSQEKTAVDDFLDSLRRTIDAIGIDVFHHSLRNIIDAIQAGADELYDVVGIGLDDQMRLLGGNTTISSLSGVIETIALQPVVSQSDIKTVALIAAHMSQVAPHLRLFLGESNNREADASLSGLSDSVDTVANRLSLLLVADDIPLNIAPSNAATSPGPTLVQVDPDKPKSYSDSVIEDMEREHRSRLMSEAALKIQASSIRFTNRSKVLKRYESLNNAIGVILKSTNPTSSFTNNFFINMRTFLEVSGINVSKLQLKEQRVLRASDDLRLLHSESEGQHYFVKKYCFDGRPHDIAIESARKFFNELVANAILNESPHAGLATIEGVEVDLDSKSLSLIFKYYPEGSLEEALKKNDIGHERFLKMLLSLCHACIHLSDYGLFHRDIKSSNLVVVGDSVVLIDHEEAGPAQCINPVTKKYDKVGTEVFTAPELLGTVRKGQNPASETEASVVYQIGMVIYEFFSHAATPFLGINDISSAANIITGKHPEYPAPVTPWGKDLEKFLHRCWDTDPGKRPLLHDLPNLVKELLERYQDIHRYIAEQSNTPRRAESGSATGSPTPVPRSRSDSGSPTGGGLFSLRPGTPLTPRGSPRGAATIGNQSPRSRAGTPTLGSSSDSNG